MPIPQPRTQPRELLDVLGVGVSQIHGAYHGHPALARALSRRSGCLELLRAWLITAPLPEGYRALPSRLPMEQFVRGATLLAAGGGFSALHLFLPRLAVRGGGALYLAFLSAGGTAFGLAALLILPLVVAEMSLPDLLAIVRLRVD